MQIRIKFTKFGANSIFGGFAPGDRMRADAALARHLVGEGVAVYDEPVNQGPMTFCESVVIPPVDTIPEPKAEVETKPARAKKGAK